MTATVVSFIWTWALLSLLALPLCVWIYLRLQRRRSAGAAAIGSMAIARGGTASSVGWRRHLPPLILLAGVALLAVASARPQLTLPLPRLEGTVVLAMDVSASMAADDVEPSRMEAAKLAAKVLAERRPDSAMIGVVAFGEGGLIVQAPTDDAEALDATIGRLVPQSGTSLGRGMMTALNLAAPGTGPGSTQPPGGNEVAQGVFAPAIVVMLTDGENTEPPDPAEVAQLAIDRGVRVHTIGVGTPQGTAVEIDGFSLFTQLNEPALQEISLLTEGTYLRLDDLDDIPAVYDELGAEFVVRSREVEVTSLVGGISALLLLISGALSLFWFGRAP